MRLIVIGADAAGMSAASQVRRLGPGWLIEAFDEGAYSSYGLCGLPYFLSGMFEPVERLVVITPDRFEKTRGIKVHTKHKVMAINPSRKNIEVVNLDSGQSRMENYDYLMIATGAAPIVPSGLKPQGLQGVFYLHNLDDGRNIKTYIKSKPVRTAAVIGAGYIGLEVAEALALNDLRVTIIGDKPAPIFEPELRELVAKELGVAGVAFLGGRRALSLRQTSGGQVSIKTEPGSEVTVDMVVVGVGVQPRSELAEAAGLALGTKKAIRVDRQQRTSNPLIYAGGDCAEAWHALIKGNTYVPLALTANRQGRVAGQNIIGQNAQFSGIMGTGALKVFDLGLARTGLGLEEAWGLGFDGAVKEIIRQPSKPGYYPGSGEILVEIIFDHKTGRLLGGQLAGPVEGVGQRINTLVAALTAGMTVKQVSQLDTAYAPPFSPVYDPVVIACEVAAKKKYNHG